MNNGAAKPCFAHRHMTPGEYGLYSHLREVSHPHYQYKFDDRTISERFALRRGSSKDAVNRLRQSLAKLGFIEWLEPQKRIGGRFVPRLGRILGHQEWSVRHPGKCLNNALHSADAHLSEPNSPVSDSPSHQSQVVNHQSHFQPHQSRLNGSPVSNSPSHQSRQRDIRGIEQSGMVEHPSQRGMADPDFLEKESPPLLPVANRQSHSVPPVAPTIQVPVAPARQVTDEEQRIAACFGLVKHGGDWFTNEGTKLDPKAVDVLFGKEVR